MDRDLRLWKAASSHAPSSSAVATPQTYKHLEKKKSKERRQTDRDDKPMSEKDVLAGRDRPPAEETPPPRQGLQLESDNDDKPITEEHMSEKNVLAGRDRPPAEKTPLPRQGLQLESDNEDKPITEEHRQQTWAHSPHKRSGVEAGQRFSRRFSRRPLDGGIGPAVGPVAERPAGKLHPESRDKDVDELAIVVDPPASANSTDQHTNNDLVSWAERRGFGGLYIIFYTVALIGAIPRCTVLLVSHALPQEPPSAAATGFLDLWKSCSDPANAFSNFSSRGILYKVMVGSDHVFLSLGNALACVAALYLMFPDASKTLRGAWRLYTTAAVCFLVWASHFAVELSTLMNDNVSLAALSGLSGTAFTVCFVILAAAYVGYMYLTMGFSFKNWRRCIAPDAPTVLWRKLCVTMAFVGCATVIWQIAPIVRFLEALNAGKVNSVLATSILCRGINVIVRWLITRDLSLPAHASNVVSMLLLSFSSIAIRRILLAESNQDPLALLGNCVKLASLEFVGRSASYLVQIIMTGRKMSGLNTLTLEGLVDLYATVQRQVDGLTSYMLVDQFCEVFVFVMITTQDLAAPIWSVHRVWMSVEAYENRCPFVLMEGLIQMGVEFVVDFTIWRLCFQRLAWDFPHVIRRILFKKPVAVFAMGVMLMHSMNFWPVCMRCDKPLNCLVFTECLFDGKVMLKDMNACTQYLPKDQNYVEMALREMRSRTQVEVSPGQLGCHRGDVDCYGLA